MKSLPKILIIISIVSAAAFAQNADERKIIKMPSVNVPFEATMSRLGGVVLTTVTVDRVGVVVSVDKVIGPDWVCNGVMRPDVIALRESARIGAADVLFEPRLTDISDHSQEIIVFEFPKEDGLPYGKPVISFGREPENDVKTAAMETRTALVRSATRSATHELIPEIQTKGLISGGVMNGKAIHLEVPEFPRVAREVNVAGDVGVTVIIDEEGRVFAANVANGHPLLRVDSRNAACKSLFKPVTLSGLPVTVTGVIVYKYSYQR